jgi:peptide/nickel transport system permease protein
MDATAIKGRLNHGLHWEQSVFARVLRRPGGLFGTSVMAGLLVIVVFGGIIAPYTAAAQDIPARLQGPSWRHLLGTDELGRDLLSRILFGVRIELKVALPAVAAALVIGLALGLASGYLGGVVDNALIIVMDTLQAFPAVILALTLLALLGPSLTDVVIVIAISFAPGYARVARASVLGVKQNTFIEAERVLGASRPRITFVHVLPNILPPLFILSAMNVPSAIAIEVGLSFLGLGVQAPTPSWGVILADGFNYVQTAPWAVVWVALVLMITTLGVTLLGESLRDVLDPRFAGSEH